MLPLSQEKYARKCRHTAGKCYQMNVSLHQKTKTSIFSSDEYDNWTCWIGKLTIIHNNKTTVMLQEAYCANEVFSLILYFICNSNANDVEDKAAHLVCSTVEFACVQKQAARKLTRFDVTYGQGQVADTW